MPGRQVVEQVELHPLKAVGRGLPDQGLDTVRPDIACGTGDQEGWGHG
jgi:hypothetical protein